MTNFNPISDNAQYHTELWTARILRLGVWISASLMILGLIIASIWPSSITMLSTNPSLGDLLARLFSGSIDPVTLMFIGLVLLMFTPILRVITALFGFTVERNWRFVLVSSIVFLMLVGEIIYSVFLKG
jgi:uncharacterized membrane protein